MVRLLFVFLALCLVQDAFPAPVKKDRCSDGMDIGFLLDASGSVSSRMWKNMLQISKRFVDEFGASENGNHFAVMTFSTKPQIDMKFNKYSGMDLNSKKINGDIDDLRKRKGYTFIDRALLAADKELFTVEDGMRQKARKVAVVLTDGIQTKDQGDFVSLHEASKGLKSKGVEIYAVGIGSDIDVMELLNMASSEDNVFSGRTILGEFDEFKKTFC